MDKAELRLEIAPELLALARQLGVDLTVVCDDAIQRAVLLAQMRDPVFAEARAREWAEENAEAIEAHRRAIEAHGVFGEDLRSW